MTNKQIVAALVSLSDQGYEIVSCDFLTGQVTFKVVSAELPVVDAQASFETAMRKAVREDLVAGRKIQAIKLHFDWTKLYGKPNLAESKMFVEQLAIREGLAYRDATGSWVFTKAPVRDLAADQQPTQAPQAPELPYYVRPEREICDCGDESCGFPDLARFERRD